MEIKINTHGGPVPKAYGDWVDLYTAEDVLLHAGEYKNISLGVSMELPKGYYAMVVPRSSTFKKWRVLMANSVGIIDNDYSGDNDIWQFPAYATDYVFIPKGIRLCQFTLMETKLDISFNGVESLGNNNRGGFGSTGTD